MAGAVAGLSPWLASAPRLPLQNLWAEPTLPGDMPASLLPISQYYLSTIAALLIVGGAAAGLAARALVRRGCSAASVAVGVATVHAVAIGQSFTVLANGLDLRGTADPRAPLYLVGMLVGTTLTAMAAQAACWLISRRSVGRACLGLVLSAVPLASWVGVWFATLGGPAGPAPVSVQVVRWLPALVVAAALGWCGTTPPRRLAIWVTGTAVLGFAPPLITAVTSATAARTLRGDPSETVDLMLAVLRAAIWSGAAPTALALLLATVLALILAYLRRRSARDAGGGGSPHRRGGGPRRKTDPSPREMRAVAADMTATPSSDAPA